MVANAGAYYGSEWVNDEHQGYDTVPVCTYRRLENFGRGIVSSFIIQVVLDTL